MDNSREFETAVTELLLVIGQLLRRLRAVSNTRKLTWSQVAIMARLEESGPMTTADLARAEATGSGAFGLIGATEAVENGKEIRSDRNSGRIAGVVFN